MLLLVPWHGRASSAACGDLAPLPCHPSPCPPCCSTGARQSPRHRRPAQRLYGVPAAVARTTFDAGAHSLQTPGYLNAPRRCCLLPIAEARHARVPSRRAPLRFTATRAEPSPPPSHAMPSHRRTIPPDSLLTHGPRKHHAKLISTDLAHVAARYRAPSLAGFQADLHWQIMRQWQGAPSVRHRVLRQSFCPPTRLADEPPTEKQRNAILRHRAGTCTPRRCLPVYPYPAQAFCSER
jgi:hypothetical protein